MKLSTLIVLTVLALSIPSLAVSESASDDNISGAGVLAPGESRIYAESETAAACPSCDMQSSSVGLGTYTAQDRVSSRVAAVLAGKAAGSAMESKPNVK